MSVEPASCFTDDDIVDSKNYSRRSSVSEAEFIDRQLSHLKEEILPFYPFLLTVPTDVPFRLGGRFVNNWAVGNDGPFTPDEQQLQYMTFLTHQEGESLLVPVGDWSDESGNAMPDQRSGPESTTSTPPSGSVKPKITLNDYKSKRKNGASSSPSIKETKQGVSMTHPIEANQRHLAVRSPRSNPKRLTERVPPSQHTRADPEKAERKRPLGSDHEPLKPQERKPPQHVSPKKPRLSPASPPEPVRHDGANCDGLPALLSPTLPPASGSPRLPQLLSPTLPPHIEKELAKLGEEPLTIDPSQQKSTSSGDNLKAKHPKIRPSDHGTPQLCHTPAGDLQSPQENPTSQSSDKRLSSGVDFLSPHSSHSIKAESCQVDEQSSQANYSRTTGRNTVVKQQLIVKLKYGKLNKKRVEALLKFSGKRKPAQSNPTRKDPSDDESLWETKSDQITTKALAPTHVDRKIQQTAGISKQAGVVPTRGSPKESRLPAPEKPRTPIPSLPNNAPHKQDRLKQISMTPVRDHRSQTHRPDTAGLEARSAQSAVKASFGDSRSSTANGPPQSSNYASSRTGERKNWKDEYQKHGNLGRELKHAAERHTAKDDVTDADEKLAVATAIEAILCFILAFVADDQSKLLSRQTGDSSTWLSIIAYWRVVKKNSIPYPRLYSLCLLLGAVSYSAIHALDLERLTVTPLPWESSHVSTQGSNGNTVASDENKRYQRELSDLKKRLPDIYKKSQKLWLEGSRALSEDVLIHEFPDTWSKRSMDYSQQGISQLKAGDFSGEFFLPVGRITSPVEMVRFGYVMLNEWCAKENVGWSGRLRL